MMLIECDKCGKEIVERAALALSPPTSLNHRLHEKFHLCRDCWDLFLLWVSEKPPA